MSSSVAGTFTGQHGAQSLNEVVAPAAAPVAPIIDPVAEFGFVVPGIYRCSASALIRGLPPPPKNWQPRDQQDSSNGKQTISKARVSGVGGYAGPHEMGKKVALPASQTVQTSSSSTASTPPYTTRTIDAEDRLLSKNVENASGLHTQAGVLHSTLPLSSVQFTSRGQQTAMPPPPLPSVPTSTYSATWAANATPTELFLASLQLRTILFLAPEKKPTSLAAWCDVHRIRLIHLGLGALADEGHRTSEAVATGTQGVTRARGASILNSARLATSHREGTFGVANDTHRKIRVPQTWWELHSATANANPSDRMSLERIAKESLELMLDRSNLPCLVCDMTGVNETGIVVGCLRRMQRFNFASIRLEYRSWAGSRSRASHERFIEMFDTDLVCTPTHDNMPAWFRNQVLQDEEDDSGYHIKG